VDSRPATVKIAAAQMACSQRIEENLARMAGLIREAKANGATVVVFPELAVTGAREADVLAADESTLRAALDRLSQAAREVQIPVVFGMPWFDGGRRQNCAFVLSAEGKLLTRYAQTVVDRPQLFTAGTSAAPMWFELDGVHGVVTIGGESLWSEIAELAAVRGAQLHLHLSYTWDASAAAALRRKQLWTNLASFRTFTATVNAADCSHLANPSEPASGGSALWDDFHRGSRRATGGYGPYSAVRMAEASSGQQMLYASQTVQKSNPQFGIITGKTNPQMKPWFEAGACVLGARQASP
jgi:predicted amidohydrolase